MKEAAVVSIVLAITAIFYLLTTQMTNTYATGTYVSPRESPQGAEACTKSGGNAEVCNPGSYVSPRESVEGADACAESNGNAEVCNPGSYVSPRPNEHSSFGD